jgi:hypothetical protein
MDRLIALRGTTLSPPAGTLAQEEHQQTLEDASAAAASAAVPVDGAAAVASASPAAADMLAAAVPVAVPEAATQVTTTGRATDGLLRGGGSAAAQAMNRGEAADARPISSSFAKDGRATASHVRSAPSTTHSSHRVLQRCHSACCRTLNTVDCACAEMNATGSAQLLLVPQLTVIQLLIAGPDSLQRRTSTEPCREAATPADALQGMARTA